MATLGSEVSANQGLLLTGATVIHNEPPRVERADIRVRDGRIVALGAELSPEPGEQVVDLAGKWVMPGMVVGHHHLYSALACGMPFLSDAPVDFADMLDKVWWRMDKALDRESVELCGLVGGVGALRVGVTTIIDHHASPSYVVGSLETLGDALGQLGLRRVLCYEVTDRGGPEEAQAGLDAHRSLLARGPDGWTATMVGAHANFTLSDETLKACGDLARDAGVGLHIHVAEAVGDERLVGEPLIDRMERLGALVPGSLLAHCVHLSPEEIQRIYDAGAWTSHQARSNMNNGVGYAPLQHFGAQSVLGTDGIGADMIAEAQAAYFRSQEGGVGWFAPRFLQMLHAAADFAGEKLGVTIGRIEPGAEADLVVLDPMPGPPLLAENLANAYIFRFGSGMVRHVMTGGQWRLWDRDTVGFDQAALDARARRGAMALWRRMLEADRAAGR
jgi:cytosine/adenosine deaminase-related metal-dependent hydrolase